MVTNYTIEEVEGLLRKRPIETSENDLKGVFELVGLQVKEYENTGKGWCEFEIHHRTTHIITYREDNRGRLGSFSHRFVNISDCDGLSMSINNNRELILITLNFFMREMRIHHEGISYSEEYFESSEDEVQTLMAAIISILNEKVREKEN